MEYMENTFKMRKETKRNTVLRKTQRAQKEKAHYQAKSRQSHVEKRAQTQIKRSPIGVKLHGHGLYTPRGPPCEGGGERARSRAIDPRGRPTPHRRLSAAPFSGGGMEACRGGAARSLCQI